MNDDNDPGFFRRFSARLLTIVGALLVVVTIIAGYVRWQAFDRETFETTAEQLIADDEIRTRIAARTSEALLANVDVEKLIAQRLPESQQGLAAPLATTFAASATRLTEELYGRPRFQELWVRAAGETQEQVEKVLDDDTKVLKTVDGKLVLDLRPIVIELGDEVAIIGRAAQAIPGDSGYIAIVEADKLEAAQDATATFKSIAPWIWVVALACFAVAILLVGGRRREEVRAISIGLIVAGVVVLAIRGVAGNYLVDDLVPREEGKEAARNAWDIITQLLADGAWSAILIGLVLLVGVILAGPSWLGQAGRTLLSPILGNRWLLYGSLGGFLLLLAWWNPIAQTSRPLYMAVFAGLLVVGAEGLLRVVHRAEAADEAASAPPPPPAPAA